MLRRFLLGVIAAASATAFIFGVAAAQETVKIGIVSAKSGPLAAPGKFQLSGFRLAAKTINAAGGFEVAGKTYKIELVEYDTRCNPGEGANALQRLVSVDQVPVVLGELCSSVAAAEAPIAEDAEVPLILTVPTGPSLTEQGNKYLFRLNANNSQLSAGLAKYIGEQNWTPLASIAFNSDAGRGGVAGMKALLPDNVDIGYVGYFNVGEVDFRSHISNIRAEGSKAVLLLMDEEPGSLAIKQMHEAGLDIQLVGTLAMGSSRFLKRLDASQLAGMVQYSSFPPNSSVPQIKEFSDAYRAEYGEEAHGFAAQSYDGIYVAIDAMKRAGTVSDGKAIRDAIAATDYEGVVGSLNFDDKGQASPPVYVTQWCDDGTRRILLPPEAAAGCGEG